MRICIYAKQTGGPCEGTAHSRQIECQVGMENACLQRCSVDCQYYEPISQRMIDLKSGEILQVQQEKLEKIVSEGDGVPKKSKQNVQSVTGQPHQTGDGCNGCNNGTISNYASQGGGYTNNSRKT